MNVSYAIEGYLTHIQTTILADFSDMMLSGFVYDESMDFQARASSFIRKQPEFQKLEGQVINDWAFLVWSRGDLNMGHQGRPLTVSISSNNDDVIDTTAIMRMATIDVPIKIYTNNVERAETIEEYFHVMTGELTHFEADYGAHGIMKCSVTPDTSTTFEKEELENVGSTIGIGLTATLHFPVILPGKTASRIEHINSRIWDGLDDSDENMKILSNEWVLTEPI